ncbi:type II secretion system protein GspM [Candidatus Williamhamiltonella defendens]|uniref:type II secretion system protein GspM n=1 Tax=Candidatus Williamhamiltonella defendens TaxID=138072 RepID=UPI0020C5BC48|nr:type II secretion system protein GspM [Candidatus Hamiltonella defensa]
MHQSAAQAGMEIIKMQEEEKALRVWIAEVSFKKLVSWLFDLQYRHGIQTAYLDLVETGIPGIVEVQRLEFIRDIK